MKLKSILIAGLLAAAAGSATANDYTAPTMALVGGPMNWTINFGTSHNDGKPFTDTYTFTYSGAPGTAQAWFLNVASPGGDLDFQWATLNSQPMTVGNAGAFSGGSIFTAPVSGMLTLIIHGTDYHTASYAGTLDVTTPVPEPESYAMLLGGLGVLAFLGRRRKT